MTDYPVRIYDARYYSDWREEEGGRWVTFCEKHGEFVQHATRADARGWKTEPWTWCSKCKDPALAPELHTAPALSRMPR